MRALFKFFSPSERDAFGVSRLTVFLSLSVTFKISVCLVDLLFSSLAQYLFPSISEFCESFLYSFSHSINVFFLLAQCLFPCSINVSSLHAQCLFPAISEFCELSLYSFFFTRSMYLPCSINVFFLYAQCIFPTRSMSFSCTLNVSSLLAQCLFPARSMSLSCSLNVCSPSTYIRCQNIYHLTRPLLYLGAK